MSQSPPSNFDSAHEPYDARAVANFILHYHWEHSEELTQLRLYKLLYFSHGWHLVERGNPLVWNHFEAWERGPVIKVVRDNFAAFREKPITKFSSMFDLRKGETIELPHRLNRCDEIFIEGVVEAYRRFSAAELSLLTHVKDSPWDLVWRAREPVGRFGLRLLNDEILRDFQDLVENSESPYK